MINKLINFIDNSKTEFDAVYNTKELLIKNGFKELKEYEDYDIKEGKYFVIRNNTSIIAFNIPKNIKGMPINIISTHTDSPSFKIEANNTINTKDYVSLRAEPYGGSIYSSWFDRPLSIGGRIMVQENNKILEKRISINDDLLVIPNLCIHFNREINNGYKYNPAIDLKPLLSNNKDLYDVIYDKYQIKKNDILSFDLKLFNNENGKIIGANKEFFMAPRIDNLASHYVALEAFLNSNDTFKIFASFDNEEVGSRSMQGAASTFLIETLKRIYSSLNLDAIELYKSLSHSIMISADNAHALHPNYTNMYNDMNAPIMNKGYVIKHNSSLSYTTDGISEAIIKKLSNDNNIAYQDFYNKENIKGGSTLGNILQGSVSIHMIDIGLPQLAMHSAYETAGVSDVSSYYEIMKAFYNSNIKIEDNKISL